MTRKLAALLALIPCAPRSATTRELADGLRARGFPITQRSVQRELAVLEDVLPLRADRTEKPFLWAWSSCPCGRTT